MDTCLKLEIPDPIFVKGTWFNSRFHLSITDGASSWVCDATEEEVRERAAQWDQPVSAYIHLAEKYLGFQMPGSVYRFTDAGDGHKRLSWTFMKEGTKLEWRWKCAPAPDCKKTTTGILDFLMEANITLSIGKNKEVKTTHETENKAGKAVWNRRILHIYCDICIRAVQMGFRPGTHFSKQGWKYVIECFEKESGRCFTKKQLKNKWDGMKKDWKIWKTLVGNESDLGWDPWKQTIAASEDWWDEKIKAIPAAEKFRHTGIEPDLCSKYDFMFSGSSAWPTSAGVLLEEDDDDDDDELITPTINALSSVPAEGSGELGNDRTFGESLDEMLTDADIDQDSPELEQQKTDTNGNIVEHSVTKVEPQFVESLDEIFTSVDIEQDSPQLLGNRGDRKQKRVDESCALSVKKERRQLGGAVKLSHKIAKLMATVESRGSVTSRRRDAQGCSIIEVMDELHSMPEIVKGSELHIFASEFFLLRTRREMWFAMREPKSKINWLKTMYDKSVSNQKRASEQLKEEAEKCLAQSERFNSEKMEFESAIYAKFLAVLNSKKQKLRELRDQHSKKEASGKMLIVEDDSDKTESFDEDSD